MMPIESRPEFNFDQEKSSKNKIEETTITYKTYNRLSMLNKPSQLINLVWLRAKWQLASQLALVTNNGSGFPTD